MKDYERLGAFYLGKAVDANDNVSDDLVLYDSKDLTTHSVIIGMTGSGKTGLGIGMIEEAAMDRIPVIAIDPKGDLGNLMLTFPRFTPEKFEPWVDSREAAEQGMSRAEFAADQATRWKEGLSQWGQSGKRIAKLRSQVDVAIYTPGSSAGLPISLLQAFDAPSDAVRDDADLYRERVQSTATSLLALLGIDADPVTSREHILIANILDNHWREGQNLDLAALIGSIQQPPMTRVGVMELDTFYPPNERLKLAMQLNNLLAAPGFQAWLEGEPLNAANLLYTPEGQPRVSILSIAHLSDNERMFFVAMLLNSLISWMRAQPGTGSLRAMLYMDEIFGYMPPIANPPTKTLLLTLLKQARAYGVGLTLSTQNPVDLDYKGLSNTGTWFIGRLQTERDKARVMEGLEGADGIEFDRAKMEQVIAGLGKRRFLLHNVHEDEPVIFNTRWVMSYLAGPLTRDQIKTLMSKRRDKSKATTQDQSATAVPAPTPSASSETATKRPALNPSIKQFFLPAYADGEILYQPILFGAADVGYSSARYHIEAEQRFVLAGEVSTGAVPFDWDDAEEVEWSLDDLETKSRKGAAFGECAPAFGRTPNYKKWTTQYKRWLRNNRTITLYRSNEFKVTSEFGESEGEFRGRLQNLGSERRDQAVAKLRKKFVSRSNTLEERLRRAEQTLEREEQQARQKKFDTAISFGSALLGAVLGRKRRSAFGTAMRRAGSISKESGDVRRAEETIEAVRAQLVELQQTFEDDAAGIEDYDAQAEELREITVKPKSTDITVHVVGLLWCPYVNNGNQFDPAWD
ncbi:MAG: DUF87 domain-containing protein [Pseudomonadota bacterium]